MAQDKRSDQDRYDHKDEWDDMGLDWKQDTTLGLLGTDWRFWYTVVWLLLIAGYIYAWVR